MIRELQGMIKEATMHILIKYLLKVETASKESK